MRSIPALKNNLPDASALKAASDVLSRGGLVGLPTETVYGLAADANNGSAVAQIFATKQRPQFNPLIAHVDGLAMAEEIGIFDGLARTLAKHFWPGPLTIVVPKQTEAPIHDLVTAGLETIGLRHPGGIGGEVIRTYGKALAAPSANRSGQVSPTSAAHVEAEFPDADLLILDGGNSVAGIESTIVDVNEGTPTLLRAGSITREMLEEVAGVKVTIHSGDTIKAPGMMQSHYAPNCKVLPGELSAHPRRALLAFGDAQSDGWLAVDNLSPSGDMVEAAANLYAAMRRLDALQPDAMCVMPIPDIGIGIALNDRLTRAAAPKPE